MEIVDLDDIVVDVGDRIAYAVRDGDRAGMRIGEVVEIIPAVESKSWYDRRPPKLRVKVERSTGYNIPDRPTLIEANVRKFVVIDK